MHLTDEQLNEYLDNEFSDRAMIEAHLETCDECAARLSDLQTLFTGLDSLPEVTLSRDIAARFAPHSSLVPQLPHWFTLTATLQAASALVALIVAIPFISASLPKIETPFIAVVFFQLQAQWMMILDMLSTLALSVTKTFRFSNFEHPNFPTIETSTLLIALAGISILWIFGNGLLLRNQRK